MAFDEKKYLDLAGLQSYDAKIKGYINTTDKVLDEAIKAVDGKLTAEVTNRVNDVKAINDKIGTVADGKTVVEMIEDAANAAGKANEDLEKRVKANEDAIVAINDPATGILKTAKDYADAEIAKEKTRAEAAEKQNADDIDALKGRATTLETNVNTLIGTDANKSVRTIANEELAAQLLSGAADADFKTLQELAAWLEDHPEDVATINLAIENLKKLVGTLPDDATATTVIGYIQEVVAAEKKRAEDAEKDLDDRLKDIEAAMGEGGSVETQITNAIAELDSDVSSAEPEAGKGVKVQVVEVDGKITAVNVTGNYDNAYDAKGAAAAAQTAAINAAATDATNKANQALADAKAYTNDLSNSFVKITAAEIEALFTA